MKWDEQSQQSHSSILNLYKTLLHIRATEPSFSTSNRDLFQAIPLSNSTLAIIRSTDRGGNNNNSTIITVIEFQQQQQRVSLKDHIPGGKCEVVMTTDDDSYQTGSTPQNKPTFDNTTREIQFAGPGAIILRLTQ